MKEGVLQRLRSRFALPAGDLLRDRNYRRIWSSILISSFGAQITLLALPLTAAVLLHASPEQMGRLTAMEILPFVLFSLPSGVWLDRIRKLPVVLAGELMVAFAVATVPLAWWAGWLGMGWLYAVAFVIGTASTTAGSASQIVLTQIVSRDRLVEAHAKNALASSGAEVAGPGLAGLLLKIFGAPLALIVDAAMLIASATILRGIRLAEKPAAGGATHFRRELANGLRFVFRHRLLVALALAVGVFQMMQNAAIVVQILFATRTLGLSEHGVGLCYIALGGGTVLSSALGSRLSRRIGPGPCLLLGFAICGTGWGLLAVSPLGAWGVVCFAAMLALFGIGAVLIFINFLALRQAVTPSHMLGRMTSTMRWLILLPAGPGALIGGWLGENHGLRSALAFSAAGAGLLVLAAWRHPAIRGVRVLPRLDASHSPPVGEGA